MKQFTLIYAFVICIEQISAQTPPAPFPMLSSYGNDPNFNEVFYDVNEFIAPIPNYNIIVTSGSAGDFGNQGICNASITQPAGNTFSADGSGMKHFRIVPSGINITYRHHVEAQYIPQFYTAGQINLHNCSVSGSGYCASTLPGGTGGIERVEEDEITDYDSLINAELQMIDNGNTSALIQQINLQDPNIVGDLFEYSPYLSDTVLIALITSNLLSISSLIEVLELNKPLSDSVYQFLSQSNLEIPATLAENLSNDVIDGDYIISQVENIYANVELLTWNGLRLNDSIIEPQLQEGEIEGVIAFIDEIESPNSDSRLIELFTVIGDHNASQLLLDSIDTNEDLAFETLYSIYNEVESEGSDVDSISNQKVEELIGVQNKNTIAGVEVQNLLNQIDPSYSYPEL